MQYGVGTVAMIPCGLLSPRWILDAMIKGLFDEIQAKKPAECVYSQTHIIRTSRWILESGMSVEAKPSSWALASVLPRPVCGPVLLGAIRCPPHMVISESVKTLPPSDPKIVDLGGPSAPPRPKTRRKWWRASPHTFSGGFGGGEGPFGSQKKMMSGSGWEVFF